MLVNRHARTNGNLLKSSRVFGVAKFVLAAKESRRAELASPCETRTTGERANVYSKPELLLTF